MPQLCQVAFKPVLENTWIFYCFSSRFLHFTLVLGMYQEQYSLRIDKFYFFIELQM